MTTSRTGPSGRAPAPEGVLRRTLLDDLPVTERQLTLAGIDTAVLEGGSGPPVVLLHGPTEFAAKWLRVIPELVRTHRVVAPDLPGHGGSAMDGSPPTDRMINWLSSLIAQTCPEPPAVVGHLLGGAIAARFATAHPHRLSHLVLVDSLGLAPLQPDPQFGQALTEYLAAPSPKTHESLWHKCAFHFPELRASLGSMWEAYARYNIDRTTAPGAGGILQTLMGAFGMPAIPPEDLTRITVPTTLMWGRHDLATPLPVAQQASATYGWPLHVIEECADDPALEQPAEFLRALHVALGRTVTDRRAS
jgi:pimeloyl-ACP methyl ester carboxylesterase